MKWGTLFWVGKTIFDLYLLVTYYARVSSEKEEQINSLENQVNFFEDYIKKNPNWTFVPGYVDEGITRNNIIEKRKLYENDRRPENPKNLT